MDGRSRPAPSTDQGTRRVLLARSPEEVRDGLEVEVKRGTKRFRRSSDPEAGERAIGIGPQALLPHVRGDARDGPAPLRAGHLAARPARRSRTPRARGCPASPSRRRRATARCTWTTRCTRRRRPRGRGAGRRTLYVQFYHPAVFGVVEPGSGFNDVLFDRDPVVPEATPALLARSATAALEGEPA